MKRAPWWLVLSVAVLPIACDNALQEPVTEPDGELIGGASASAIGLCNGTYVSKRGHRILVLPSGTDDTRNIQCALDAAMPGDVIQLVAADYHTAQIAVVGFKGTFRGKGPDKTVIRNLPDLVITAEDFFGQRPGPDNTFPSLFAFWESDLTISHLAVKIVGEAPTTGWSIFGLELRELAHAILVIGRTGHVRVHDVLIEGQESPGALVGTNLISGIYTEGWFGGNPDPLTGSFIVERSTFRVMGDPFPYSTVDGFRGRFVHNTVERVFGVSGGDLANASVEYKDNTIESVLGIWLYNVGILPYGVQNSDILVRNNRLSGEWGAFFEATFGPHVRCRLVNNDTKQTENGLFLGAGESVCKVLGRDAHRGRGGDRDEAVSRLLAPLKTLRGRS